eukprot:CAMPEP_0198286724 /NCGR_PEP_ID=MMETSP1449-20131203/5712_1 /TAXON_ID=420275 /ORGANISM="Attheya septentrionalis, Strain CCMP2084" /LENGTH=834 /DNA_ID=CAMNT_0043984509 /DNA_START=112 /DNA_END=2616 /DNA_ORIENTATION=-
MDQQNCFQEYDDAEMVHDLFALSSCPLSSFAEEERDFGHGERHRSLSSSSSRMHSINTRRCASSSRCFVSTAILLVAAGASLGSVPLVSSFAIRPNTARLFRWSPETPQQQQQQQSKCSPRQPFYTEDPSFRSSSCRASTVSRRSSTLSEKSSSSSSSSSTKLERVEPLQSIPAERRIAAVKALDDLHRDAAAAAAAANALDTTADWFLTSATRPRPKGRPDSVPGATSITTLRSYKGSDPSSRVASQADDISTTSSPTAVSMYNSDGGYSADNYEETVLSQMPNVQSTRGSLSNGVVQAPAAAPAPGSTEGTPAPSGKKLRRRTKTTGARDTPQSGKSTTMSSTTEPPPVKKRKQVVKILPKARPRPEETGGDVLSTTSRGKRYKPRSGDMLTKNLQRYYKTQLLTRQEEYSLGMKIHFMMQCEEVHEGLSIHLMRVPSISEWAYACGFTTSDPEMSSADYEESDLDMQIRPTGSESIFDEPDPNMFVGNGRASDIGPGRGYGRVKKTPPIELKDFYDDSVVKFEKLQRQNIAPSVNLDEGGMDGNNSQQTRRKQKRQQQPINRGTPRDFVEMMLTGKEAKQRMIQCNMRLVVSIARKYYNVGVNVQDLVQEGSIGLARAAEKFEPSRGFKFSTYASWWIQQAVFKSIANHSRTIRLPVHIHTILNRVRRTREALQQELGRTPTNEEIAGKLDMTVEKFNKMLRLTRRSISLEKPKYAGNPKNLGMDSETTLGDTIDSSSVMHDEQSPEKTVDQNLFQSDIKEMLQILGEDERAVIVSRYGLEDGLTRTVTAVAAEMRQTKAWVRLAECRALRKLRKPWYEQRLKEHQNSLAS